MSKAKYKSEYYTATSTQKTEIKKTAYANLCSQRKKQQKVWKKTASQSYCVLSVLYVFSELLI